MNTLAAIRNLSISGGMQAPDHFMRLLAWVAIGLLVGGSAGAEPAPLVAVNLARRGSLVTVDGDDAEWAAWPRAALSANGVGVGTIALAYDADALYACWGALDASPMRNRLQDPPNHFKEGDALDLLLGPWRAEAAPAPIEGDLRVVVVPDPAAPVVHLLRQVDGDASAEAAVNFSSPVRTVRFASVTVLEEVQTACVFTTNGYRCELRIPFTVLRLRPPAGGRLLGDMGILSSNEGGIQTDQRRYYFNALGTTVSDLPTEAELTPNAWGEIRFEP